MNSVALKVLPLGLRGLLKNFASLVNCQPQALWFQSHVYPIPATSFKENRRVSFPTRFYSKKKYKVECAVMSAKNLKRYQKSPCAMVIDIRDPKEICKPIKRSVNIPLCDLKGALKMSSKDFKCKYGRKKPDKKMQLVFIGKRNKNSKEACKVAARLRFKNISMIDGGAKAVEKFKRKQSKKKKKKKKKAVKFIVECKVVGKCGLKKAQRDPKYTIIDVRCPMESKCNPIKKAVNIPLSTLREALRMSSKDFSCLFCRCKPGKCSPILFVDEKGTEVKRACKIAVKEGYELLQVLGGGARSVKKKKKKKKGKKKKKKKGKKRK